MNVVLHSARNIFYLIAANCILGILTASFCVLIEDIERFAVSLTQKKFVSLDAYISVDINSRFSLAFTDLIACLLAASFLLLTTFIYNSGSFRLISIPAFIFGFVFGRKSLSQIIKYLINRIFFSLKWIFDIVVFPITWLTNNVIRLLLFVVKRIKNKHRTRILTKYTAHCFSHIKDEAQYGLIDDYYKELENERTV